MKEVARKSWIHALQLWVKLCEIRVQILDHAILTATSLKSIEKLARERDKILVSSHSARLKLERLRKA
jgi:hypothetical protein